MSQVPTPTTSSSSPSAGGKPSVSMSFKVALGSAFPSIVNMPPALVAVFGEMMFDLTSHHRLSVLKYNKLPSGNPAKAMIASRFHHYGRKRPDPQSLNDVVGESFMAAVQGETFGEGFFEDLERGRTITTSDRMAVPIGLLHLKGKTRSTAFAKFREEVRNGAFFITKGGLLIRDNPFSDVGPVPIGHGKAKRSTRTQIVGFMTRKRRQTPQLTFFDSFDRIWPQHAAKFEQASELAQTAAGQARLIARQQQLVDAKSAAYKAYVEAYRAAARSGITSTAEKRKVARAASAAAKQRNLALKRGAKI